MPDFSVVNTLKQLYPDYPLSIISVLFYASSGLNNVRNWVYMMFNQPVYLRKGGGLGYYGDWVLNLVNQADNAMREAADVSIPEEIIKEAIEAFPVWPIYTPPRLVDLATYNQLKSTGETSYFLWDNGGRVDPKIYPRYQGFFGYIPDGNSPLDTGQEMLQLKTMLMSEIDRVARCNTPWEIVHRLPIDEPGYYHEPEEGDEEEIPLPPLPSPAASVAEGESIMYEPVLKQSEIDWITQNWTPLTPMKSAWQEQYSWMDFDRSGRITSSDALIALKAGAALSIGLNTLAQDVMKISVGNDKDTIRDYSKVKEADLRHLYYPEESQGVPDTTDTPGTTDAKSKDSNSNLNLFLIGGGFLLLLYLFSKKGGGNSYDS